MATLFVQLQCSCLENPMDRGAWRATVRGVTKELDVTATEQKQQPAHRSNTGWNQKVDD